MDKTGDTWGTSTEVTPPLSADLKNKQENPAMARWAHTANTV